MLELDSLLLRFGDLVAVDHVSFTAAPGRMTGFVGANGAGKTTTMRLVLGVAEPDAGRVLWQGRPVTARDRRGFGYMPEERGLYPKMGLVDQLAFLARLHGVAGPVATARSRELLERLGLGERTDDRLDSLSLGNQQRVQIAAALVHEPTLLVLDEPFSGLDPLAVDTMAALLREQVAAGVPVLFSSHQLELVERLCDDVVVINGGKVVTAGPVDQVRRGHGPQRYRLVLDRDAEWLRDLRGVQVLAVDGPTALLTLPDVDGEQRLLRLALDRGAVREFAPVVPSLAELYREVVA